MKKMFGVACVIAIGMAAVANGAESRSAALARELASVLTGRRLDAFAAVDPEDSQRFVAAMVFPGQLLVIAGRYPTPPQLQSQLQGKAYRDVYAALHSASDHAGRVFVHDMGADGLHAESTGSVDIVYENGIDQRIFDGHPERRDISKAAYQQQFQKADEAYRHLLQVLTAQARPE